MNIDLKLFVFLIKGVVIYCFCSDILQMLQAPLVLKNIYFL